MPALFPSHLLFMKQHHYPLYFAEKEKKQTQREGERNASPTPLLFHQDLFYFCSVPFISFHWPAVCLYSHIKVTFATPFPPKSPPPLFFSLETKKKKETHIKRGGYYTYFPGCKTIPDMWGDFFFKLQLESSYLKNATADVVANPFGRVLWWLILNIGDSRVHVNWHV